ncbi:hypothetical protein DUNSADRAFT_4946 [Dunaliella salina]|uniref:Encoded protein n=1 Tax=Dunaliella salina TaxID=3046 RepID=A0ABQ7GQY6_DUNSA|nr:hypothetical protein DUNSADRAFT_4946 [Dunaliella salina]|eukprot:KAF5837021.1 hypothetical protein DUNSADRAFT_4946 [Dunaliella salina]
MMPELSLCMTSGTQEVCKKKIILPGNARHPEEVHNRGSLGMNVTNIQKKCFKDGKLQARKASFSPAVRRRTLHNGDLKGCRMRSGFAWIFFLFPAWQESGITTRWEDLVWRMWTTPHMWKIPLHTYGRSQPCPSYAPKQV